MTAWVARVWRRLFRRETPAEAEALYPYLAAFLDDPDVGPILKQSAAERWDPEQLEAAVKASAWWQEHKR